jgi:hypothetical protein
VPPLAQPSTQRLFARLAALALLLAALIAAPAPAAAQNAVSDFLGSIFGTWRAPPPRPKPATPVRRPKPHPAASAPATGAPTEPRAAAPAVERPPPSFFVAVIGDSLAGLLAQGLAEAFAADPRVAILNRTREDSGLVRDDFHDWRLAAKKLLDGPQHIDMAVMLIGINDNQKLRMGDVAFEPLTKPFNEIYARRAEEIATAFRNRNIPLVWVGLPIMRSDSLAHAALAFNEMSRQYAGAMGAHYVDLWEPFADVNSAYKATGPDVSGALMRLRTADGVHFTKAGARKAAHFVEAEIRRRLEASLQPPTEATPQNSPQDSPPDAPSSAAPPAEAPTQQAAEPPPKPLAGKIQSLSEPALSPGGALAGASVIAPAETIAQPGRADDFRWPAK